MVSTRVFVSASVLFAVVAAVPSSPNVANVLKRSPLLEGRQKCPAGYIPACPVGIPCVPPGAVCCDDGFTYVMPPDTCPEGTLPVATASNQGQETPEPTPTPIPEPTPEPTLTPTPSSETEVPTTTVEPTTEVATSTVEPTTTSTYVQPSLPTLNTTIPSTGLPVPAPSYSQVPVAAGSTLKAIGLVGFVAALPAVLLHWL